jgi:hypothetical protein
MRGSELVADQEHRDKERSSIKREPSWGDEEAGGPTDPSPWSKRLAMGSSTRMTHQPVFQDSTDDFERNVHNIRESIVNFARKKIQYETGGLEVVLRAWEDVLNEMKQTSLPRPAKQKKKSKALRRVERALRESQALSGNRYPAPETTLQRDTRLVMQQELDRQLRHDKRDQQKQQLRISQGKDGRLSVNSGR